MGVEQGRVLVVANGNPIKLERIRESVPTDVLVLGIPGLVNEKEFVVPEEVVGGPFWSQWVARQKLRKLAQKVGDVWGYVQQEVNRKYQLDVMALAWGGKRIVLTTNDVTQIFRNSTSVSMEARRLVGEKPTEGNLDQWKTAVLAHMSGQQMMIVASYAYMQFPSNIGNADQLFVGTISSHTPVQFTEIPDQLLDNHIRVAKEEILGCASGLSFHGKGGMFYTDESPSVMYLHEGNRQMPSHAVPYSHEDLHVRRIQAVFGTNEVLVNTLFSPQSFAKTGVIYKRS